MATLSEIQEAYRTMRPTLASRWKGELYENRLSIGESAIIERPNEFIFIRKGIERDSIPSDATAAEVIIRFFRVM